MILHNLGIRISTSVVRCVYCGETVVKELGLWHSSWRDFFFFPALDFIKTKKGFVENDRTHSPK